MKNGTNKLLILLFSLICVGICVFCASLISSAITVSGSATAQSSFSKFKIYAISLGSYISESSAETLASEIKEKGGAGFVFEKDGKFHVLASAYEKENDAKKVQENLSSSGIISTIVEIEIDEPSFQDVSSQNQQKIFSSALLELKNVFLKLYDVSVSLDTKTVDETKAKIQIIETKGALDSRLEQTTKGSSSVDGIYYQIIKNSFTKVDAWLDELKNYEAINGVSLSAKTKFVYISVLEEIDDLISSLENKF